MMLRAFCLILLFSLNWCHAADSGVQIRVTQKWLDYVQEIGMANLKTMLQKEMIPDIRNTAKILGKVEYNITEIKVEEFKLPRTSVTPKAPTDVHITINDSYAAVSANWKVKKFIFSDHGKLTLNLSEVSIKALLRTFRDDFWRPSVLLAKCQSTIGKAKVHFSGGASWLYNLFSNFLEKPIRNHFNTKLCAKVSDVLDILNRELRTFMVEVHPDPYTDMKFFLVDAPKVTDKYIDLHLKGEVYPIGNPVKYSVNPVAVSLPDDRSYMLYAGLSNYFFYTLATSYFIAGALEITLTNSQFPDAFWLRTEGYKRVFSENAVHYPESWPLQMTFTATQAPVVILTPGNLTLHAFSFLKASTILPDSNIKAMFSLHLKASLSTNNLQISQLNLTSSLTLNRLQLSEINSAVGNVDVLALENAIYQALQYGVVPVINERLRQGFPLPTLDNIALDNPVVNISQNSVLISTDMSYIPWKGLLSELKPQT